jgi:hypothetical protein
MATRFAVEAILASILPCELGRGTVEGRVMTACVDGLVGGHVHVDLTEATTRLTNPGATDMISREVEKMMESEDI